MEAVQLIRDRVKWCETEGVDILCCPEAVLGRLADDAECPENIAIDVENGQLEMLLPLLQARCEPLTIISLSSHYHLTIISLS